MRSLAIIVMPLALSAGVGVTGCTAAPAAPEDATPEYLGVETRLLDDDLVNFRLRLRDVTDRSQIDAYARCAAAQYALIRGYGFARHLRTNVTQEGGIWRGDAVYTISAALPRGLRTVDAEVVAADCAENGIPMV